MPLVTTQYYNQMDAQRKDAKKESHRKRTQRFYEKMISPNVSNGCVGWGKMDSTLFSKVSAYRSTVLVTALQFAKLLPHRPSHLLSVGAKAPRSLNRSTFGSFFPHSPV